MNGLSSKTGIKAYISKSLVFPDLPLTQSSCGSPCASYALFSDTTGTLAPCSALVSSSTVVPDTIDSTWVPSSSKVTDTTSFMVVMSLPPAPPSWSRLHIFTTFPINQCLDLSFHSNPGLSYCCCKDLFVSLLQFWALEVWTSGSLFYLV